MKFKYQYISKLLFNCIIYTIFIVYFLFYLQKGDEGIWAIL